MLLSSQNYKNSALIFENLKSKNYAVIKGEPLSFQAYGKCGERHLGDIDILIERKELTSLETILQKNGFRTILKSRADKITMLSFSHQIAPYIKENPPYKDTMIDINFDIFWGEYKGKRIDIGEFLSDTIFLEIYGVKIKALPPLKTMIQLILHHYKDMNSLYLLYTRKSYNIAGLRDVYHLLKSNLNDISCDKLYDISEQYNIIPYVYYVLYHVGMLYEDNVVNNYIREFKTSEGVNLINCYGLNESEQHEWNVDVLTRLKSKNLNCLIKNDFTEKEMRKIELNRRMF